MIIMRMDSQVDMKLKRMETTLQRVHNNLADLMKLLSGQQNKGKDPIDSIAGSSASGH